MHDERNERIGRTEIETTLWDLAYAIRAVSCSDEEAFAVLESMITEGRISIRAAALPTAA